MSTGLVTVSRSGDQYRSTKTYGHQEGLSCVFRQPLATSHCRMLHGYALSFKFTFACDSLDDNGWVVDFGSCKRLKEALHEYFDHTVCVASKDEQLRTALAPLERLNLCRVVEVDAVGCEAFAALAHYLATVHVCFEHDVRRRLRCISVECAEHGANSAIYIADE